MQTILYCVTTDQGDRYIYAYDEADARAVMAEEFPNERIIQVER